MDFESKALNSATLPVWRESLRAAGKRLVVTNGCFDLLHRGHATYLQEARNLGDALLVGVTGDAGVTAIKGPGRPINSETDRAMVLAALESVSAVFVFSEHKATRFLEMAKPDVYVKGGDYQVEQLPLEERQAVQAAGGEIRILKLVPGKSTTSMVEKINRL